MVSLPPVGAFGLSRIGGVLGMAIAAGQAFTGDGSRYTHAFVVISDEHVVEAMPSGARLAPLAERMTDPDVRWCDAPVATEMSARWQALVDRGYDPGRADELVADWDTRLRLRISSEARALVGARYGFSDYLALTLAHLGIRAPWLRAYVARSGRLICSQLVDEAYHRAGVQLFDDGRLPMDVTPGDLDHYRVTALEAAR